MHGYVVVRQKKMVSVYIFELSWSAIKAAKQVNSLSRLIFPCESSDYLKLGGGKGTEEKVQRLPTPSSSLRTLQAPQMPRREREALLPVRGERWRDVCRKRRTFRPALVRQVEGEGGAPSAKRSALRERDSSCGPAECAGSSHEGRGMRARFEAREVPAVPAACGV